MRAKITTFLIFILFFHSAFGQSSTLNGVYAGLHIMPSAIMGGGMSRDDMAFLFRKDGTFTDQLNKPNWKTRVDGRYTVTGKAISMKYTSGTRTHQYKLDKDGNIDAGGYSLIRQPTDSSVPPGYYKFSKMNSTGGGSSGMVYAGVASDNNLNFDGKGNFSNNKASATAVIGSNVGGGNSRQSSGKGTYTIDHGSLTLNFEDGRKELHSFFARPGFDPVMAVIDGNIFFMEDEDQPKTRTAASVGNEGPADNAKSILMKANEVHGGSALDNLKAISLSATMQGMTVNSYIDVAAKRLRLEVVQSGKIVRVEQLEGQSGWLWQQGKSSTLPAERINEMGAIFYSGILGLRKMDIESLKIKNIKNSSSGTTIAAEKNGKQLVFLINKQSQLIGSADNAGKLVSSSVYSDFRTVKGVLVAFKEANTVGRQKSLIAYEKFEINPSFSEATWAKPL